MRALAFGLHCWGILKCLNLHQLHGYLSYSLLFRVGLLSSIMILCISVLIFFRYFMWPFREFKITNCITLSGKSSSLSVR